MSKKKKESAIMPEEKDQKKRRHNCKIFCIPSYLVALYKSHGCSYTSISRGIVKRRSKTCCKKILPIELRITHFSLLS